MSVSDIAKRDVAWRILNEAIRLRDLAQSTGHNTIALELEHVVHEANSIVHQNGGPPPTDNVVPIRRPR
jgi:hypothetical protein